MSSLRLQKSRNSYENFFNYYIDFIFDFCYDYDKQFGMGNGRSCSAGNWDLHEVCPGVDVHPILETSEGTGLADLSADICKQSFIFAFYTLL